MFLQQADLPQWAALSQRVDLRNGQTRKTHALVTTLCKLFKVRGGMQFTAIALVSSAAFDGLNVWLDLRCRTKQDAVIDVPAKWVEIVHRFNQAVKLELK